MTVKAQEEIVRVVAPSNLNEGYTFPATTVDGRSVTVKVPTGGVAEGEEFDAEVVVESSVLVTAEPEVDLGVQEAVPAVGAPNITKTTYSINADGTRVETEETRYPDGRVTTTTTTMAAQDPAASTTAEPEFTVPTGAWRHDLFSCFDACSSGNFWMPCCFTYIALGQLLQRMKLNFVGSESGESYKHSCAIWTIITFVVVILTFLPWSIQSSSILIAIEVVIIILAIIALTQARYYMRRKYSIPADCCADSGFLSDCCCMSWCTCCGIIQMLRHTHDEKEFAYDYTSPTGLHSDAPEIV